MSPYKKETYYVETDDGKNLEINKGIYYRSYGKGKDELIRIKDIDTNKEIGQKTEQDVGVINYHGDYRNCEIYIK